MVGMTTNALESPDSFVRSFTALLAAKNIDAASAMISSDCEYDNVPIGKAFGPQGLRDTLTGFSLCVNRLTGKLFDRAQPAT